MKHLVSSSKLSPEKVASNNKLQNKIDILIVDDNVFNLQTLKTMIKVKFGVDSTTVHNGHHAIKMVQQEIEFS